MIDTFHCGRFDLVPRLVLGDAPERIDEMKRLAGAVEVDIGADRER